MSANPNAKLELEVSINRLVPWITLSDHTSDHFVILQRQALNAFVYSQSMAIFIHQLLIFVVKFETENALTVIENFNCFEFGVLGEQEGEFVFSPLVRLV